MKTEQLKRLEMIAEAGPYKLPGLQSLANMLVGQGISADTAIEIVKISSNSCIGYYTTDQLPEVVKKISNLIKGEETHVTG